MTKRDAILTLIVLIVLTTLMTLETNETLKEVQTTADVLNHRANANTAKIERLNYELDSKQFDRVAILRQIQTLIMEGKWSEVLATRVEK